MKSHLTNVNSTNSIIKVSFEIDQLDLKVEKYFTNKDKARFYEKTLRDSAKVLQLSDDIEIEVSVKEIE